MTLTAEQIAEITGAEGHGTGGDREITSLLTDSRDLTFADSTLFFAISTFSNDGHNFIAALHDAGVRAFVISRDKAEIADGYPDSYFLLAGDPLDTLQSLGAYARGRADIPVVGITGSRGKTIQKEMIYMLLRDKMRVARSPRSFNSQIGVPLSLWQTGGDTDALVIEAGISRTGEMDRLEEIIRPTVGVFTSLTDEHAEGFASMEEKAREKARLFRRCSRVVIPADTPTTGIIRRAVREAAPGAEIIEAAPDNKSMALAAARMISKTPISTGETDHLPENISPRIDVTSSLKDCVIVYDAFTGDMTSLHEALNATRRHVSTGRKLTCILTSRPQDYDTTLFRRLLLSKGVSRLVTIGDFDPGDIPGIDTAHIPGLHDFLQAHSISDFEHEVILIRGDADTGAEDVKSMLEAPRHATVLEVDLGAVRSNFNFFRSRVKPTTGVLCMVKADGYGAGALELSKSLQAQGAAYLGVAVVDEGVSLRQAGVTMPIIVMNPITTNYKSLFDNRLEPSVFSLRELQLLLTNAAKLGVRDYPVHIKLDTGMHRLGFLEDEIDALLDTLDTQPYVKVKSVFSHLATADCLDEDAYTESQLDAFARMSGKIKGHLTYPVMRHVLNTAGILRYPGHQYDMVRLGIGLYGVSPIDGYTLAPVSRLLSTIISIKRWDSGVTIGYGRKGKVTRPSVIATVPIGYADGLNRRLSNGGAWVLVNGHRCDIIGNICMDQCMVDVTDAGANIGDTVEIFGKEAPLTRLSDTLGTIPYEVLTSVSPRVKRIYFRE